MIMLQRKHYKYIMPFDKVIDVRSSDAIRSSLIKDGSKKTIKYENEHLGKEIIITGTTYENFYKLSGFHAITRRNNEVFYCGTTVMKGNVGLPIMLEIKLFFRKLFGITNKVKWANKNEKL